ncbi:MAG: ribonuclease III [Actinomycetota bacterium]|nr:ribonuclease III [Actinomycetota bacterium]
MAKAEKHLGITFSNKNLLKRALTHSSFAFEMGMDAREVYERIEFLGDAILNFVITDFIFYRFPGFNEGELAKFRANLVNSEVLAKVAQGIGLGEFIFMGKGAELTGGRERTSILADCFEAVLGAIYLDQSLSAVREFILKNFKDIIFEQTLKEFSDFKTTLQEYTMEKLGAVPEYQITREEGPVHERIFHVEVLVQGKILGKGMGRSKKKAEQRAAQEALETLRGENND